MIYSGKGFQKYYQRITDDKGEPLTGPRKWRSLNKHDKYQGDMDWDLMKLFAHIMMDEDGKENAVPSDYERVIISASYLIDNTDHGKCFKHSHIEIRNAVRQNLIDYLRLQYPGAYCKPRKYSIPHYSPSHGYHQTS